MILPPSQIMWKLVHNQWNYMIDITYKTAPTPARWNQTEDVNRWHPTLLTEPFKHAGVYNSVPNIRYNKLDIIIKRSLYTPKLVTIWESWQRMFSVSSNRARYSTCILMISSRTCSLIFIVRIACNTRILDIERFHQCSVSQLFSYWNWNILCELLSNL